jgi:hypothetical protein
MSTITYDIARAAPAAKPAETSRRKGFFARFMEARQRRALADLRRHGLLLPHELEQAGWKINERSEDSLPFVR